MKQQLDDIRMDRLSRVHAEARRQRAEVIAGLFSRTGAALKGWIGSAIESVRGERRPLRSPVAG